MIMWFSEYSKATPNKTLLLSWHDNKKKGSIPASTVLQAYLRAYILFTSRREIDSEKYKERVRDRGGQREE